MYPWRRAVFLISDQRQESFMQHIADHWHNRKTVTTRMVVPPEILIDSEIVDDDRRYAAVEVRYRLDNITRDYVVVSRKLAWYVTSGMAMSPAEIDPSRMVPVQGNLSDIANALSAGRPSGLLVLEATALCLPMSPDLFSDARNDDDQWVNVSSPDTSQSYPLDNLLTEIENLTR